MLKLSADEVRVGLPRSQGSLAVLLVGAVPGLSDSEVTFIIVLRQNPNRVYLANH